MNILKSKKFLTLLLDTVISITLFYLKGESVVFLVGALQPIFISLILAYATEEVMALRLIERLDEDDLSLLMERLGNK